MISFFIYPLAFILTFILTCCSIFAADTFTFTQAETGHVTVSGGSVPAVSSCGTSPTLASGSNDHAGKVTIGTGTITACTLTFGTAYTNAPACVGNVIAAAYVRPNTSTTAVVFTFSADSATSTLYYICYGVGE